MLRGLLTFLSALSLLLCVATCVLWIRSYWYASCWDSQRYWTTDGHGHQDLAEAISWRGGLCYRHSVLWVDDPLAIGLRAPSQRVIRFDRRGEKSKRPSAYTGLVTRTYGGFGFLHFNPVYQGIPKITETDWRIAVPYWFVTALFALPPAGGWLALRRARLAAWRLRHLQCVQCGYDLRASANRCPECGAAPTRAK